MVQSSSFQRARRPEQKESRQATILAAATELAAAKGVRGVNLGDISNAVGLARSNVLRYFGTREEIYLRLAAERYVSWAERVTRRLAGSADVAPSDVARCLADSLSEDPLFCDLISQGAAALEHNVSLGAMHEYKRVLFETLDNLATVLADRCSSLTVELADEILSAALALTAGMWPWNDPPGILAELARVDPAMARPHPPFARALSRIMEAVVLGVVEQAARETATPDGVL